MKIDRLISIITTLQQKGKVTAPYLAEKLEVSRRTINRDIEDICRAGIPIVTTQGTDGGIELMEGYHIDTTIFTEDELQSIFIGLKSLDSVSNGSKAKNLSEKIGGVIPETDHMMIDLSSFYKVSLSEKIELLKKAIHEKLCVTFHYYYNKGDEEKLIEPAMIVYKWASWYVLGFCPERNDFRLYKLSRLWNLFLTNQQFHPREIPPEKLNFGQNVTDDIIITALYEPSEKYRLVEEYGPDSFNIQEDGWLNTQWSFTNYESATNWFLSFGNKVKILAPKNYVEIFKAEVKQILELYQ